MKLGQEKRRFSSDLNDELRETAYKSYWTKELGRVPDQVPGLPLGMDSEVQVFGKPTGLNKLKDSIAEDVFQTRRPFGEIKLLEEVCAPLYRKSHHGYLVGQRRDHHYEAPARALYGKPGGGDESGSRLKNCLEWNAQPKRDRKSKAPPVGRTVERQTEGTTWGLTGSPGAGEVPRYVRCIVKLRNAVKSALSGQSFIKIFAALAALDKKGCGCIPLENANETLEKFRIAFDKSELEMVLRQLDKIKKDGTVSFHALSKILNAKEPLPDFKKVDGLPERLKLFESTYQGQCKDLKMLKDTYELKVAGISNNPLRIKHASFENGTYACINPTINDLYGIEPNDYLVPRRKEYMQNLWKRIGVEMSEDTFDALWNEAEKLEGKGDMLSVSTFKKVHDAYREKTQEK